MAFATLTPREGGPDLHFLLGDDAFALMPWVVKPYSRRQITREERIANYRIRYVKFDHIWQRQIKQFVYASNIILIETNMPFPAQVKFPQNYINELYKNLL